MLSLLSFVLALLYYLCFVFLVGMIAIVAAAPQSNNTPATIRRHGKAERRQFCFLALSLLLWQVTLFLQARAVRPDLQLYLGRLNFAAVALTVFLAWDFVRRIEQLAQGIPTDRATSANVSLTATLPLLEYRWLRSSLWIETTVLTLVTLLTPLMDAGESVIGGHPVARFGMFFPLYLLHVLSYLGATLLLAFLARRRAAAPALRAQLTLIAFGILATGSVALVTNALLPYIFGDFRFCDVGALSTLLFLVSVAYAVFVHGLFDLRFVLRMTLVYGVLLSVLLGGYSSVVFVTAQYLTGKGSKGLVTQFAFLCIAFSFDPLRRFLLQKIDGLLFGEVRERGSHGKRSSGKRRKASCAVDSPGTTSQRD